MKKISLMLIAALFLSLIPLPAFANVIDTNGFVVYPDRCTGSADYAECVLESFTQIEVPEEYSSDYYDDAYAYNVVISNVVGDSFTFMFTPLSELWQEEYYYEDGAYEFEFPLVSNEGYSKADMDLDAESTISDEKIEEIVAGAYREYNGFEVTLENGKGTLVVYYYPCTWLTEDEEEIHYAPWMKQSLEGSSVDPITPTVLIFNFSVKKEYTSDDVHLISMKSEKGQFENEKLLYSDHYAYYVTPFNTTEFDATLQFDASDVDISINGTDIGQPDDKGYIQASLVSAMPICGSGNGREGGYENSIIISQDGEALAEYRVLALTQRFEDLPDRVEEYLCIGSQYTNKAGVSADYGLRAVRSLVGSNGIATGGYSGPVSLGNFGGYITYYYEDAIIDDPNNPYGIDFITFGNSFEGSNEFGEPGQVWVSYDGESWYALAGGMHYENYADWNYSITYSKTDDGYTDCRDSYGNVTTEDYYFPSVDSYPWYRFSDPDSVTLTGIRFEPFGETNEYGNVLPPFAGFGYTDMGPAITYFSDEDPAHWSYEDNFTLGARNIAGNPYLGLQKRENRIYSDVTDGMDLAWAVNSNGQPVSFPNGIHYVKIVTASNIINDGIGEKSTEVNMVRVAQANSSAVGVSDAPDSISFDGTEVDLSAGTAAGERSNVVTFDKVVVDGEFEVKVETEDDAHVYINNNPEAAVTYDQIPDHKIVRVIVQNDKCEPRIYVFNLREMTENEKAAKAVDELIEAIGDPEDVTLESAAAITAAREAYDKLTDAQKALVTKTVDLTAAEAKYAELKDAADQAEIDKAAAKGVDDAIGAIGDVTLDSESAITAARAAYEALTEDQKALVTKADELTAAEEKLAQLKEDAPAAQAVEDQIAAIGEVTRYKQDAIESARAAYDALTDSQKALVGNLDVLEAAEAELDELLNGGGSDDTIKVSFRLIGSTLATEDVDLSKGEEGYYGAEYQNWVKTKTYTMHSDDSVYDLFVKATGDAGIESKGASSGYVKSIKAPDALGGYWLSEFTNGKYSGWMYTMDGKHANAIKDQILVDGAEVVFHYVNDYRYEVEDWFDEPAYPSLATDDTFYSRWLEAEDVKPGGQSGGTTPAQPGEETPGEEPVDNPDTPMGGNVARRFIDVSESDWFNDAVEYAVEHDIMAGTGETTFSPQKTLTRGMLASMLYSMEGAPAEDGTTSFTDVDPSDWFAKGVEWAVENGVTAGYGERFGPNDDITREQMVVMLYGYAKMKGYELVEGEDLSSYEDAGEISSWALPAMQWAKAAGLVSGRSAAKMAPQGTTTRAEAATIMRNFLENVAK